MEQNKPSKKTQHPKYYKSLKRLASWKIKNEFLKDQIATLEKGKKYPIFSISCFLLKTQLIEFELKQLITSLDLHLYFSNNSKVIKVKIRRPKDLDEKRLTLGRLKDEIIKYDADFLKELQLNLTDLVVLRNHFVHGLFNIGKIDKLCIEAKKGIKTANKTIASIELAGKFLSEHDPLAQ